MQGEGLYCTLTPEAECMGKRESIMRGAPALAVRSTVNSRRVDLRDQDRAVPVCALVILIKKGKNMVNSE